MTSSANELSAVPNTLAGGVAAHSYRKVSAPYWMQSVLLMAAYLAASTVGLWLAPSDEFPTPFWPSAGIALGALMVAGLRLWPALAIAALFESLWSVVRVSPDLPQSTIAMVVAAESVGVTLQAVLAAAIARDRGRDLRQLSSDGRLVRLFLWAGGLCSIVHASVLVAAHYSTGLVDSSRAGWLWLTTWCGDATGVFLVTPLIILYWASVPERRWRRFVLFGAPIFFFAAFVTIVASQLATAEDTERLKDDDRIAQAAGDDVRNQFHAAFEVLYGARELFDSSTGITEPEFQKFVSWYLRQRPGLQAVGWVPRVADHKRERFEARQSRLRQVETRISEFDAEGRIVPASSRAEYAPLRFSASLQGAMRFFGFDVLSLPNWHEAAQLAIDRGEPVAASPVFADGAHRLGDGVFVLLPLYRGRVTPTDVKDRRELFRGFMAAQFDPEAMLLHAINSIDDGLAERTGNGTSVRDKVGVKLLGRFDGQEEWPTVGRLTPASDEAADSLGPTVSSRLHAAGRDWMLLVESTEENAYVLSAARCWLLYGGTVSAALVGAFALVLAGRSAQVDEVVAQRTRELAHEVAERRKAEAAAQASESWLEVTQDAARIGVWEWNVASDEVHASVAQGRLFGREIGNRRLSGAEWLTFSHPDDRERVSEIGRRALVEGGHYICEARTLLPDGGVRWLRHEGRVDRDASGVAVRIIGASWDITSAHERATAVEEQQRRFRALTENSEIGFWQVAPDGHALYLNAAICRLLEVDRPEDAMGLDTSVFFAPESLETLRNEREKRKHRIASTYEATIKGRHGRRSDVMISAAPILDAEGNLQSTIGSYIDITELKAAEARLRESENELASIYHGVSDAVSLWKVERHGEVIDYRCLRVNRAALETFGGEERSLVGRLFRDFVPSAARETLREHARRALNDRKAVDAVETVDIASGRRTFEIRLTPLFCAKGNCSHLLVAAHDVTARVQAEGELRRAVEFRDSLIEHATEGLCISQVIDTPPFVRFSVWNRRMEEITGYTIDDVNRFGWLRLLFPESAPSMEAVRDRVNSGENVRDEVARITRPDGQIRITRFSTTQLTAADGKTLVLTFVDDMTEREHAVEALRASEERYRGVVTAMAEGVLIIDERGVVEGCNASLCAILQVPESQILGRYVLELFSQARDEEGLSLTEPNCSILRSLTTGVSCERRLLEIPQSDGESRWLSANTRPIFDANGRPKAALATITDITSLKVAAARLHAHEEQLAHVSRVSTMGEFVAGIAHEINQPLHAIANFAGACERSLTEPNAGEEQIENALAWTRHINASVRQAASVIRRLRDFFRRETAKRESASLSATVRDSLELTSFLIKEHGVAIDLDLAAGDERLVIDRVQIQQVLVNLIRNAIEAVASLPLERRRVEVRLVGHADKIEVIVGDSGFGVPADQIPRLFEPFYTTKPDGMGMGLPITKTIVESHGGEIWYQPRTDEQAPGGEFRFTLPRFAEWDEESTPASAQQLSTAAK
jgi:PAS domain S-box-containing protein